MRKFLQRVIGGTALAAALLATAVSAQAEEKTWETTFKVVSNSQNQSNLKDTTPLSDICESGAENFSAITNPDRCGYASQFGLKIGENKKDGSVTFQVASASAVKATKVVITAAANKNDKKLQLGFNETYQTLTTSSKADGEYTFALTGEDALNTVTFSLKHASDEPTSSEQGYLGIKKIVVYYEEGDVPPVETIAAPVLTMTEEEDGFEVSMTCETEDAVIYYTTDETNPTVESTKYEAPVLITSKTVFKAIAIKGDNSSAVTTIEFNPTLIVSSFRDLEELDGTQKTPVIIKNDMAAVYQNGSNLYVTDSEGDYILVYGTTDQEFKNGDTFSRVEAKYTVYNGVPELMNAVFGQVSEGETVEPEEEGLESVTVANVNRFFEIKEVKVAEFEGQNSTMSDSEDHSVVLYNKFNLENPESGDNCTVIGFVSVFKGEAQFYPISIEAIETPVELGELTVTLPDGTVAEENGEYTIYLGEIIKANCENATEIDFYAIDAEAETVVDLINFSSKGTWKANKLGEGWTMEVSAKAGEKVKSVKRVMFTLNIKEESGVETIAAENGDAIYFNLQGVRVERPAKGQTVIRVNGGKTAKVVY